MDDSETKSLEQIRVYLAGSGGVRFADSTAKRYMAGRRGRWGSTSTASRAGWKMEWCGGIWAAVAKPDGRMIFNPPVEMEVSGDDVLIVMGEQPNLRNLENILTKLGICLTQVTATTPMAGWATRG
jgi:hypothetical protein